MDKARVDEAAIGLAEAGVHLAVDGAVLYEKPNPAGSLKEPPSLVQVIPTGVRRVRHTLARTTPAERVRESPPVASHRVDPGEESSRRKLKEIAAGARGST